MKVWSRDFAYAAGDVTCIALWPVCLLIDLKPADQQMTALAELLGADQPIEAVVDFLSQQGVSKIPSFGLISVGADRTQVVVHGTVRAIVDGNPQPDTRLIAEAEVGPDSQVVLMAGDQASTAVGEDGLVISSGVVKAGAISWPALPTSSIDDPGAASDPTPARMMAGPVAPVTATKPVAARRTLAEAEEVNPTPEPVVADDAPEETLAGFEHLFQSMPGIGSDREAAQPDNTPDQTANSPVSAAPGDAPDQAQPSDRQTSDDEEDLGRTQIADQTSSLVELGLEDELDEPGPVLSQASQSVPDAAGSSAAAPGSRTFIDSFSWEPPSSVGSSGRPAGSSSRPSTMVAPPPVKRVSQPAAPVPPATATPLAVPPEPARPAHPALSPEPAFQVPPEPVPPVVPAVVSQPVPFDATVRKSNLTQLTDSGEVMVVAFVCPQGHYSPPYATTCRVCGLPLEQNQPVVEVARPVLGVLRLWGGGSVYLDRGVVFGRNPRPIPGSVGPEPSLVRIEDPNRDVSSQHCEVRLEDWFVTVRDLNSTNGTQVILPHRPPVTLRAHEPMTLEPGTRVVLAQAFDFVFEVV